MISRGAFVVTVAGSLLAPMRVVMAQQAPKVLRVGFISGAAPLSEMSGPDPVAPALRAFLRGLRSLGYVEGQNLVIERRTAEARFERVHGIVAELIRSNVDVIVAVGHGTALAAKKATTVVPIVIVTSSTDPVADGLVQAFHRPGGNVTGFTTFVGPELEAKRLELFTSMLPGMSRVAYLASKENQDWELPRAQTVRDAAQHMGVTLVLAEHTLHQYAEAFELMRRTRVQGLFVSPSPAALTDRALIADLANRALLPSSCAFREQVEAGALVSYGVNLADVLRRAAGYVDKIFRGAKPMDLPLEQPAKFELVINRKTAKTLGVSIAQSFLARADELLE